MWPGYRALRYYLRSAITGNEDLGERCLHGARICINNIVCFYGSESRISIYIYIYNIQWTTAKHLVSGPVYPVFARKRKKLS